MNARSKHRVPTECLVGFDARVVSRSFESEWPRKRCDTYLFKEPGGVPLSADPSVLPTVFDSGSSSFVAGHVPDKSRWGGMDMPDWIGISSPLWSNLEELQDYVHAHTTPSRHVYFIALSKVRTPSLPDLPTWPYLQEVAPKCINKRWSLLGYDVLGTSSLVSGLTNCSYTSAERAEAMTLWGRYINEHHLFRSIKRGVMCVEWTNRRIPEHAPFWLCGLYRVPGRRARTT
jgi:hypothetical protein